MDTRTSRMVYALFAWTKMVNRRGRDNDMITSFSNPNYHLNDDELNSNITDPLSPGSTQYFDAHLYGDCPDIISTTTTTTQKSLTTSKRRKNYAQLDIASMGINLHDPAALSNVESSVYSPDSLCSLDSRRSDDDSLAYADRSDSERQTEELSNNDSDDEPVSNLTPYAEKPTKGFLGYYASLEQSAKSAASRQDDDDEEDDDDDDDDHNDETRDNKNNIENKRERPPTTSITNADKDKPESFDDKTKCINSPDSNDSGIQADVVQRDDVYDNQTKKQTTPDTEKTAENEDKKETETLPPGWQKHEDEDGPYYWHIKSGTIQRDPPKKNQRPLSIASDISWSSISSPTFPETPGSLASAVDADHLQEFEGHAFKYATESLKSLYTPSDESTCSTPSERERDIRQKPIRFAVRSLGWVGIAEEDLTPERSSKAVNKCIVDLSLGRNDINDVVGRWGDGKDLYMDLDSKCLTLTDPTDESILNRQPIQSIRVWGVGRDNGRDFAYVARDQTTRQHMCHVFRCDTPARQIANTLRDICRRIMMERSMQQGLGDEGVATTSAIHRTSIRPNNLPNLEKTSEPNGQKITFQNLYKKTSFPTPMEEPKKVLRGHYLGTVDISRPSGVEMLNEAMEQVYNTRPSENWHFANIAVAPSTITITEHGKPDNLICECRVRFLSFMGIAMRNVKLCGFIMHSAQNTFVAHVFHCEPSAGALCKTIEAACKLRYQKCLDAHPSTPDRKKQTQQSKGLRASLKAGVQNVFGMLKGRKVEEPES